MPERKISATRGDVSAVKSGGDFLALDGWEIEWQQVIREHPGLGGSDSVEIGFDTQISASNQTLTLHPPANPCRALNKMG
jgi:hypothetical protein